VGQFGRIHIQGVILKDFSLEGSRADRREGTYAPHARSFSDPRNGAHTSTLLTGSGQFHGTASTQPQPQGHEVSRRRHPEAFLREPSCPLWFMVFQLDPLPNFAPDRQLRTENQQLSTGFSFNPIPSHHQVISHKRHHKSNKPGIVVSETQSRNHQTDQSHSRAEK
jgi:hypothetical protein